MAEECGVGWEIVCCRRLLSKVQQPILNLAMGELNPNPYEGARRWRARTLDCMMMALTRCTLVA